jgi:hypothetical protein|nr:MAG TPA: hypothetical protein [Caudoviricetes sp.]
MERLTRPNLNVDQDTDRFLHAVIGGKEIDWKQSRDSTLNVLINGPTSNGFGKDIFRKMARDLYGRLKAYEDIAELCGGIDRLRELAEADKDGRCVVLPCKVGDTVWFKTYKNNARDCIGVQPHEVTRISASIIVPGEIVDIGIPVDQIGVRVFLSETEAVAADAKPPAGNSILEV